MSTRPAIRRSGSGDDKPRGVALALPAVLWLSIFFLLPLLFVLVISFLTPAPRGEVREIFTWANYQRVFGPVFPVLLDSIWLAFVTTIICLILGYPLAFYIATRRRTWVKQFALFLVILPFWTNFLVRTYAWRVLLGREGTINTILTNLGVVQQGLELLNTDFAVLVGLVYGFLPFMVLPIYASVERLDFRLAEASYDLGANDVRTFFRVILPLTMPGVLAGSILVFIPTIGAYVTPDLLGGTSGLMIGNIISNQFLDSQNWPLGSAASMVMMAIVGIGLIIYTRVGARRS